MKLRTGWLFGFAIAAILTVGVTASAGIRARMGPPPQRRELIVARPGPGKWWGAGYWRWNHIGARCAWFPGRWIAGYPGYARVGGGWWHRHGGWRFRGGYWRRR